MFSYRSDKVKNAARLNPSWRDRSLFEWLIEDHPDWFQERFRDRQLPPHTERYQAARSFTPDDDEDLTEAYHQTLALTVAENWRQADQEPGRWEPQAQRAPTGPTAMPNVALARRAALMIAGVADINPKGAAVRRLLEENLDFPAGRNDDGSPLYEGLRSNYFLSHWNRREAGERQGREGAEVFDGLDLPHPNVKYVVIAGAVPNAWGGLFPNIGDNDLVVEVASAFLPLGENDSFHLFSGLDTHHTGLKTKSEVGRRVVAELRDFYRPSVRWAPSVLRRWWRTGERRTEGKLEAGPWEPAYIEINSDRLKGTAGRLSVDLRVSSKIDEASGLRGWVYLESPSGEWIERRELVFAPKSGVVGGRILRAELEIEGFGQKYGRVMVGTRLPAPDLQRRGSQAIYRSRKVPVSYRLEFDEVENPGRPGASEEVSRASSDRSGQAAPDLRQIPGSSGQGQAGPPLRQPEPIVVRRSTRETSNYEEDRTYHRRWVWDFGDGQPDQTDDPGEIVSHRSRNFPPGEHRVTTTSFSNQGEILRQKTWEFRIEPPKKANEAGPTGGVERSFSLETIREPRVRFRLDAPKRWVTGRPAGFRLEVEVGRPAHVSRIEVDLDPGRDFQVVWERPGRYTVKVAAIVRLTYDFPEGSVRIRNVYVHSVEVEVLTIGMTD